MYVLNSKMLKDWKGTCTGMYDTGMAIFETANFLIGDLNGG